MSDRSQPCARRPPSTQRSCANNDAEDFVPAQQLLPDMTAETFRTSPTSTIDTDSDAGCCNGAFADDLCHSDKFPLYAMRLEDVKQLVASGTLEPMQMQLREGRIQKWDPSMGKLLFISHQWLDWNHPDPGLHQFREFTKYVSSLSARSKSICNVCDKQPTWAFGHGSSTIQVGELIQDLECLWIWYDFLCVPQPHDALLEDYESQKQCDLDFGRAILSIPSFVEQSSYFLVLAPSRTHCRSGSVVDYQAWGQRGWCRLELSCRVLAQHSGPVMVLTSSTEVCTMRAEDYFLKFLAVGRGEYACCSRDHIVDGREVPCDRFFAAQVLSDALSVKLHELIEQQDFESYRWWMSCRAVMFDNLPTNHMSPSLLAEKSVRALRQKLNLAVDPEPEGGFTLMRYAVMSNNLAVVRELLWKGHVCDLSQPLVKDDRITMRSRGSTLVHEAARCLDGQAPCVAQNEGLKETMLELLHRFGADLSERDAIGCTVLHYAARTGRARNVLYVLRASARHPSRVRIGTRSAVPSSGDCASRPGDHLEEPRKDVVNVEAEDIFGCRALHFAAMHTFEAAVFDALLEVGGVQIDAQNKLGSSPLHMAAIWGNRIGAQALLRHASALGCDCVDQQKVPRSPETWLLTLSAEMLYRLGKRTATVVMFGQDSGGTPLSNAARYGHKAICDLLVNSGANPASRSASGWTPAEQAYNSGHHELASHLDPTLECRNEAGGFMQCSDWPTVSDRIRRIFQYVLSDEMQEQLLGDCRSFHLSGCQISQSEGSLSVIHIDDAINRFELSEAAVDRLLSRDAQSSDAQNRLRELDEVLSEMARRM